MSADISRVGLFALNPGVIVPCDEEDLPANVDQEDDLVCWLAFESPELGRQCSMIDPSQYRWGQISGLQMLKFLHERIETGGRHVLVINPGSNRQMGMDHQAITDFLEWLEKNPEGLNQF